MPQNKKLFSPPAAEPIGQPSLFVTIADRHPAPVAWQRLADLLRADDTLRTTTLAARRCADDGDDAGFRRLKTTLPAFTPAATMNGGHSAANIVALTGVSMVDFDGLDDERLATTRRLVDDDPHTLMAYTTCSGHGLRVLFRYLVEGAAPFCYTAAWLLGNAYYAALASVPYDASVKDPSRLSYLSHDPDALLRLDAKAFVVTAEERLAAPHRTVPDNTDTNALLQRAWDLSTRAGHTFVEGGRHSMMLDLALLHCKMGIARHDSLAYLTALASHDPAEAEAVVAWVFDKARPDLWTPRTTAATRRIPVGHAADSPATASADGTDTPPAVTTAAPTHAGKALPVARYREIAAWVSAHCTLRQNILRHSVEAYDADTHTYHPLSESERNSLMIACDSDLGLRVRRADFDAVLQSDCVPLCNPFAEYLDNLPPWDGVDHIGRLCATVHTDSNPDFFRKYFEKWFVSILPGVLDHAATNQVVMVFLGRQGCYKSTFFRLLLPPQLSDYFLCKTDAATMDKDSRLALCEFALVCLEEISTMTPRELEQLKGLITQTVVAERAPYAHSKEPRPHIASFCATGNDLEIFGDMTGLRRWVAFKIEDIDSPFEHPFDHTGLYSQALHLWRNGFRYWFDNDDIVALERHMERFRECNLEEQQILRYYRRPDNTTDAEGRFYETHSFVTTAEILERCTSGGLRGILNKNNIGKAMANLGFRKHCDGRRRGYIVYELSESERQERRIVRHE